MLYGLVPSDDKTLQKVAANGKLHKAASADQHYVGSFSKVSNSSLWWWRRVTSTTTFIRKGCVMVVDAAADKEEEEEVVVV